MRADQEAIYRARIAELEEELEAWRAGRINDEDWARRKATERAIAKFLGLSPKASRLLLRLLETPELVVPFHVLVGDEAESPPALTRVYTYHIRRAFWRAGLECHIKPAFNEGLLWLHASTASEFLNLVEQHRSSEG